MRRATAALLVLILTACTSMSGGVQTGRTNDASTEDFDLVVEQTNQPMVMHGQRTADVRFAVTVQNRTDTPWRIDRIALQSMGGGNYAMPVRVREYNRVIAPGEKAELEFWGTVDVADDLIGTRAPITMRATLYANHDGQEREEEFMQRINGRVSLASSR